MCTFKYIYGPVSSWRLGSSLGIDVVASKEKVCTFDCLYCQLGRTRKYRWEREVFVRAEEILEELERLPPLQVDYVTLSGNGEPTLARNLGELIALLKDRLPFPVAVITNSSTIMDGKVAEELYLADCVIAKLDASAPSLFRKVNRPWEGIAFDKIVEGLRAFQKDYAGRFAIQVMLIEENKGHAREIASIVNEIAPHEVQVNTPLRPSACRSLPAEEIRRAASLFLSPSVLNVYDGQRKTVQPISEAQTIRRRGRPV